MNKTADTRATSYIRRLRLGDKFVDEDGAWEVAGAPKVRYSHVRIHLRPWPNPDNVRGKTFQYPVNRRVHIVR